MQFQTSKMTHDHQSDWRNSMHNAVKNNTRHHSSSSFCTVGLPQHAVVEQTAAPHNGIVARLSSDSVSPGPHPAVAAVACAASCSAVDAPEPLIGVLP